MRPATGGRDGGGRDATHGLSDEQAAALAAIQQRVGELATAAEVKALRAEVAKLREDYTILTDAVKGREQVVTAMKGRIDELHQVLVRWPTGWTGRDGQDVGSVRAILAAVSELADLMALDGTDRDTRRGRLWREFAGVRAAAGSAAGPATKVAARLEQHIARQGKQDKAIQAATATLAAAAREARDAVAALQAHERAEVAGDDALTLLVRLLREEPAVWRHAAGDGRPADDLICWHPGQVTLALTRWGVPRVEVEAVRRTWHELGLAPAETDASGKLATFNRRLRDGAGGRDRWAAVPVATFTRLRVRVPRLPDRPPPTAERAARARELDEAVAQFGGARSSAARRPPPPGQGSAA